jgi:hypothetical protein
MQDLAKIAYEAYATFLLIDGHVIPTWEERCDTYRAAWDAAVQSILDRVVAE